MISDLQWSGAAVHSTHCSTGVNGIDSLSSVHRLSTLLLMNSDPCYINNSISNIGDGSAVPQHREKQELIIYTSHNIMYNFVLTLQVVWRIPLHHLLEYLLL